MWAKVPEKKRMPEIRLFVGFGHKSSYINNLCLYLAALAGTLGSAVSL